MDALNQQLFQWIGGGHAPDATLLWIATQFALVTPWVCAGLIAVAAWRRPADRIFIVAACLLAAGAGMLAHALADLLDQPRPFMLGLSPRWIPHGNRGAMPSAHASVMFTVALCLLWRPRLRVFGAVLAGLALLTGWGRVYVGVHFPFDVAGGLLLACVLTTPFGLADLWLRRTAVPALPRHGT
jgi:membrane-associated phospholipid phosphatase